MNNFSLLTVALWLVATVCHCTNGECCPRTYIQWAADTCWPFKEHYDTQGSNEVDPLSRNIPVMRCEAKVCNDGRVHDGSYCGKGKCDVFGCNCDGGCIEGDPEANFRLINNISYTPRRLKRSGGLRKAEDVAKILKSAYDGYKEGQLSAENSRRDRERARASAATVPPPVTKSYAQKANEKYKPRYGL